MDDKELLNTLKAEMLLAEARAIGAKEAYQLMAVRAARKECNLNHGDKIVIKFSDGDLLAEYGGMEWSTWEFSGYKGPALYGWNILKSGARSKTRKALCTFDMFRDGHVETVNAVLRGAPTHGAVSAGRQS